MGREELCALVWRTLSGLLLSSPAQHLTGGLLTYVAHAALSLQIPLMFQTEPLRTCADLSIKNRHHLYSADSYGLASGD